MENLSVFSCTTKSTNTGETRQATNPQKSPFLENYNVKDVNWSNALIWALWQKESTFTALGQPIIPVLNTHNNTRSNRWQKYTTESEFKDLRAWSAAARTSVSSRSFTHLVDSCSRRPSFREGTKISSFTLLCCISRTIFLDSSLRM